MIEIVARSEAMREAIRLADRVAATDANVLITGESGVGKDATAFYIHSKSGRASQSFVKIDCATLPSGLLEAELFGYERGAFTGASEEKPGRLEASIDPDHRARVLVTASGRRRQTGHRDPPVRRGERLALLADSSGDLLRDGSSPV